MSTRIAFVILLSCAIYISTAEGTSLQKRQKRQSWSQCLDKHRQCVSITNQMNVHFEKVAKTSIVPVLPEAALDSVCQVFTQSITCYNELYARSSCVGYNRYYVNSVSITQYNDTYDFLCNIAKIQYINNLDCFNDTSVKSAEVTCAVTYNQQMALLQSHLRDPYYLREQLCLHIDVYLDCLQNSTHDICNLEAAMWIRVLFTKSLEGTYKLIGCALDTSGYLHFDNKSIITTTSPGQYVGNALTPTAQAQAQGSGSTLSNGVIIGLSVAVSLVIIGLIALVVIKYKYDKKKAENSPQRRYEPNIPAADAPNLAVIYGRGATGNDEIKGFPFGPSNEALPEKMGNIPPPVYSSHEADVSSFPEDNRNNMTSPPPPYVPEADDGIVNPLYDVSNGAPPQAQRFPTVN